MQTVNNVRAYVFCLFVVVNTFYVQIYITHLTDLWFNVLFSSSPLPEKTYLINVLPVDSHTEIPFPLVIICLMCALTEMLESQHIRPRVTDLVGSWVERRTPSLLSLSVGLCLVWLWSSTRPLLSNYVNSQAVLKRFTQ